MFGAVRPWLRGARGRDAWIFVSGLIGLALVGFVLLRGHDPETRLSRVLSRLSPQVQAVVLNPRSEREGMLPEMPTLRQVIDALLKLPEVPPGAPLGAVATVVAMEGGREIRGELYDAAEAARLGVRGDPIEGFVFVGPPASRTFLQESKEANNVDSSAVRFVRGSRGLRLLARLSWIKSRFPLLAPDATSTWSALRLSGDLGHLQIEGLIPEDMPALQNFSHVLLPDLPAGTVGVIDGLPLAELIPSNLPPILAALREETGVTAELTALVDEARDVPTVAVLQGTPPGRLNLTVGLRVREEQQASVFARVRALLEKRAALSHPTVVTIRTERGKVRHLVSEEQSRVREETRDGWAVLVAPGAAGTADLVTEAAGEIIVVGTSAESVHDLAERLQSADARFGPATVTAFFDGELLRALPAAEFLSRGSGGSPRWLVQFRSIRLRVSAAPRAVTFLATVEMNEP